MAKYLILVVAVWKDGYFPLDVSTLDISPTWTFFPRGHFPGLYSKA